MKVTTGQVGDTTQLGTLLESLDDIESVSGDTGYLPRRNCELEIVSSSNQFFFLYHINPDGASLPSGLLWSSCSWQSLMEHSVDCLCY
jgi:hypothetical protein